MSANGDENGHGGIIQARIHHDIQTPLAESRNDTRSNASFTPPLHTAGRYIVDANGERYKLASVNWYGASDVDFVPGGLDFRHRDDLAATIKAMGFNSVRFPYSDQMVLENPIVPVKLISANLDLLDGYELAYDNTLQWEHDQQGPRALDVFKACVDSLTDAGLTVIINDHITNAQWCDGKNLCDSSWKNSHFGPICKVKQTTESWIENWKTIMRPHINNPLVIGADLRNEPRGLWGTMTWDMFASACEKASEALLKLNPDWLMFVEGVSSANDCSGARLRPIQLSIPDRVVYSSHIYSWSGWGSLGKTYGRRPYESFARDMDKNWGYLLASNTAPVWAGEFGAPDHAQGHDRHYWDNLMRYLLDWDVDFGYWALNPRKPNLERESYGLLEDDWETPIAGDYRLVDMHKLMKGREKE
ncbi:glycoside hydrolase family 5 protein [Acrodontium crateriforme]|uniref:Glycoside hydrolase family 5 protein n=1 Tax=Acrodontium crateriforme TaxID=150365 RepID=A0AAQ3MCQ0_9PEZI|nr:glycoside hydrolase family 5 protein [Acrodontium crateriforme]